MRIGIGLPNTIRGAEGHLIPEWARRAEEYGFSGLATIDRIAYPNYDSLISLAAAAGVTERVDLVTNVLLAPLRNPVLLAKEAASVDQISGGRLILGMGVGGREDDYQLTGQDFKTRGRRFNEALDLMQAAWRGEGVNGAGTAVGPAPTRPEGVRILIGGTAEEAVKRTVRYGIGWTAGGMAPEQSAVQFERIRQAWKEAGREGEPRLFALAYYALGDNAQEGGSAYLHDYYSFLGQYVDGMAAALPRTAEQLRDIAHRFEDAGTTDLMFDPTIADLEQVDLLAEAVLGNIAV